MDNPKFGYMVDGKPVKKFLFARWLHTVNAYTFCMVEAFTKDHAVQRLLQHHVGTDKLDWDFVDECPPESWIGRQMGSTLELLPVIYRKGV